MRKINRQREQGIALLLSILCLLLLTAVAAGMMYLSATETAINGNFKSEESAYFAARAGVEEVRDRILPANANTINASLPTALPTGAGGVLYVLNGVSAANITNNTSPYFDDELCHDFTAIGSWYESTSTNQRCTTLPSGTTWYTCVPSTCSASNSAYDPVGTRQMRNSQHRVQPILVASASQVAFQSSVNSYGGSRPLSLAAATSFDGLVSARPHDAPGAELRGDGGRLEQSRRKMR